MTVASSTLRSSLWMLASSLSFAVMSALVKVCMQLGVPFTQAVFYRGIIAWLLAMSVLHFHGSSMKTVHWKAQLLRGVIGIVGVFAYFGAVVLLPLASAITLIYTSPLLLAAVMLIQARQRPSLLVLATLGAGFVGVLLLVQPSFSSTQWLGVAAALLSAFMTVAAAMHIRTLARLNEPAWRTVAWFSLFVMLAATPGYVSSHPGELSWKASLSVLAMGLVGALGQVFLTFAYEQGHALLVSLLGYAQIVFTTLIGMLWWHEHPGLAAWLGIALIVGSGGIATSFMGRVNIGRPPRSS